MSPGSPWPDYVPVAIQKTPNGPPERRQWALVGWELQTPREDAGVGAKEHGRVPYMRHTKKLAGNSLTTTGRNMARASWDVKIVHLNGFL
jgi:hypothetical protein